MCNQSAIREYALMLKSYYSSHLVMAVLFRVQTIRNILHKEERVVYVIASNSIQLYIGLYHIDLWPIHFPYFAIIQGGPKVTVQTFRLIARPVMVQ